MEYIYAAMILHTTEQDINEENVTKILEAAGADVDESRVKALIAALEDVDIEEAMETTAMAAAPAAAAPAARRRGRRRGRRRRRRTSSCSSNRWFRCFIRIDSFLSFIFSFFLNNF